jgi:hypothetical protein
VRVEGILGGRSKLGAYPFVQKSSSYLTLSKIRLLSEKTIPIGAQCRKYRKKKKEKSHKQVFSVILKHVCAVEAQKEPKNALNTLLKKVVSLPFCQEKG